MTRKTALLLLLVPLPALAQDTTAPYNGMVDINGGSGYTNSATVSLAISAEDDTAVTEMCISNSTACTAYKTYATTYSWYIGTSPQGTRTVYVKFRDAAGNVSSNVMDTVVYDTVAPTGGTLTATASTSGTLDLSWGPITEATSGIASYKLVYSTTSSPTSKCTAGTTAYTGADTSTTLTGLTDGTTYYFRLCATDNAGNTATGITTTGVPKTETSAPTGMVVINADAMYSTSASVTLTLSATDDTGVTQMCVSNTTSCTAYQTYTTTKTWSLSGNGTKTVYVYFKDASGNISTVATDSIIVDSVKPTNGTVTATAMDMAVGLSWTGFSDAGTGLASYKVVRGTTSPASCSVGTIVYSGTDASFSDSGLTNGTTYYYRVCAVDTAGNVSTGSTASAKPVSELDAPTNASILINGGNAWTSTSSVTLTLSAEDPSGVAKMCISNSTTCTSWITYATSKSWTLSGSGTTRTVYATFEDSNGNRTSAVSDTIQIDTVKPTNGTLTATPSAVAVALSWSGFSDATSGVASYKVVYTKSSTPPSTCSIGTVGYTGADAMATVSGLLSNTTYSFRVCAIDAAGNVSTGSSVITKTTTDTVAPTGTVMINSGVMYTNSPMVDLTLAFTDDNSGVKDVCVSESAASCTSFMTYATSLMTTLTSTEGTHTVYATVRDNALNTSSAATDSIVLDMTDPTDGTASAMFTDADTAMVSWSGFSDALSGIADYAVAYNLDGSEPASCSTADLFMTATGSSATIDGLSSALTYSFRVCATDNAGNVSAGDTISAYYDPFAGSTFMTLTDNADLMEVVDVVAGSGAVYAVGFNADEEATVVSIHPTTGAVTTLHTGAPFNQPSGITLSPDGMTLYVADVASGTNLTGGVYELSVLGGSASEIGVYGSIVAPGDVIWGASMDTVLISGLSTAGVAGIYEVNVDTGAMMTRYSGAPLKDPLALAMDDSTGMTYVVDSMAAGGGNVAILGFNSTWTMASTLDDGFEIAFPGGLALSADGGMLFYSTARTSKVVALDLADWSATTVVTASQLGFAGGLAMGSGDTLYITDLSSTASDLYTFSY